IAATDRAAAAPLLRPGGPPAPPRLSRTRAGAALGPRGGTIGSSMAIEFGERIRRIPAYPLAAGYDLGQDMAMLASNESCFAPRAEVIEAAQRALSGVHRYPDPSFSPLRGALADRYG